MKEMRKETEKKNVNQAEKLDLKLSGFVVKCDGFLSSSRPLLF